MKINTLSISNTIVLIIVAACVAKSSIPTSEKATIQPSIVGSSPPTSKPTNSSIETSMFQINNSMCNSKLSLDDWIALRNLSMSEIQKRFSMTEANIRRNTSYFKLTNLTELHNPKTHPGFFYFRDNKFVLLYVGLLRCPELEQMNYKALEKKLGGEGITLSSRSGSYYYLSVYPEQGIAFSSSVFDVSFIEIFQPMTIEEYKSQIYEKPLPFDY